MKPLCHRPFFIIIFSFLVLTISSSAQSTPLNANIDSLLRVVNTGIADSSKINAMVKLCDEYSKTGDIEKAKVFCSQAMELSNNSGYLKGQSNAFYYTGMVYYRIGKYSEAVENQNKSLEISEATGDKQGSAMSLNSLGNIYNKQGNYEKALENYFKALKLLELIGDKQSVAYSYNNIGSVHLSRGDYEKAIENFISGLKIKEEMGDKKGAASSYNNIGLVYFQQRNFEKALENQFSALKIREEFGDKKGIAESNNNMGTVYLEQNHYDKALNSFSKALELQTEIGNKPGIANAYKNMGNVYNKRATDYEKSSPGATIHHYQKALENYFSALKISEETGDKSNSASTYNNIAGVYTHQKKFAEAEQMLNKSLSLNNEIGNKAGMKSNYNELADHFDARGDYKNAYVYHKKYAAIKDSLLNEETNLQITRMNTIYETDKKQKEIELLNKDNKIQTSENKKQRIIIYSAASGLVLVLILVFFIFRSNRQINKANKLLEKMNLAISQQKEEIKHKNIEITDSINYASRIQHAILPGDDYLNKCFNDYCILFQPKDIVSGDFYWTCLTPGNKVIWATVDCTGHGVPGAFMSMIGNSLLNEIVVENKIEESDQILNKLREGVIKALKQTGKLGSQKDGMDIALCVWNKNTNHLQFSGANNPLWLLRNNECIILHPDKQPIGYYSENVKPFTKQEIELVKKDTIYTFTDGYEDQFGGPKKKKFMAKRFRELLLSVQYKSMHEQKEALSESIIYWMDGVEQIDDICVFGVRV